MSQAPTEHIDPKRSFQELLAEIKVADSNLVKLIGGLSPTQRPLFEKEYEAVLARKISRAERIERIRFAATFAHSLASRSEVGSPSSRRVQAGEADSDNLIWFSVPFAKKHCTADAIVYRYLQKEQAQVTHDFVESYNKRSGLFWVRGYSAARIHDDLDCFKNEQTVLDSINRLEKAGLIKTERTGKLVEEMLKTGRKRDIAMWLHTFAPINKGEPTAYVSPDDAQKYGLSLALLVTLFRHEPEAKHLYATDLAKRLPPSPETIRKHVKALPKL